MHTSKYIKPKKELDFQRQFLFCVFCLFLYYCQFIDTCDIFADLFFIFLNVAKLDQINVKHMCIVKLLILSSLLDCIKNTKLCSHSGRFAVGTLFLCSFYLWIFCFALFCSFFLTNRPQQQYVYDTIDTEWIQLT